MKVWDVAGKSPFLPRKGQAFRLINRLFFLILGQPKFRSMWERYCKDNDAIVSVHLMSRNDPLPYYGWA